jgi:peptidoglycan/xylan/chitin deacetylase (PgdA/CDA1 family)
MRIFGALALVSLLVGLAPAGAAECPQGALGVSRTIAVDPTEHVRLGSFQYGESLPLQDHEVVLTFDDGPLPPYTSHVLDTLASECVKATFFMVGRMVRAYPAVVRRVYEEGHTIANHSQSHPFTFHRMSVDQASREIEEGFQSLQSVLPEPGAIAPFFRVPGLLRQNSVEQYLAAHSYMTWSVDFLADDWTKIKSQEVVRRAMNRIEARGRGILLLHDIQPRTALALPEILKELKARGFKIVHVVPATADRPKTATLPEQWLARHTPEQSLWSHPLIMGEEPEPVLSAPSPVSFGVETFGGETRLALAQTLEPRVAPDAEAARTGDPWPRPTAYDVPADTTALPVPAASNFKYARPFALPARAPHRLAAAHRATAGVKPRSTPPWGGLSLFHGNRTRPYGHQLTVVRRPTNLNAPLQR